MIEAEEVNSTYLAKGTQIFGKKTEAIEEPSEEGEASVPNKVNKSAIAKSAENEEEEVDNSQTTPPTPNTATTVGYL